MHATATYEAVDVNEGLRVRRHKTYSSEELLHRTLSYALATKDSKPMIAWLHYFMRTEP